MTTNASNSVFLGLLTVKQWLVSCSTTPKIFCFQVLEYYLSIDTTRTAICNTFVVYWHNKNVYMQSHSVGVPRLTVDALQIQQRQHWAAPPTSTGLRPVDLCQPVDWATCSSPSSLCWSYGWLKLMKKLAKETGPKWAPENKKKGATWRKVTCGWTSTSSPSSALRPLTRLATSTTHRKFADNP